MLAKAPTGTKELDEITHGGIPRGRTTLVAGGPGCGKTVFALQFLARGASDYGEPGVFVSFEESVDELVKNSASLGFDLNKLVSKKKLSIDNVRVTSDEIIETGEYDLEGLFVRLNHAIDSIGAKRIVLDTIETIFSSFSNQYILRSELMRLFRWLKDKGVTVIVTGEKGENSITRSGLEEYVSDCVIFLDHRIINQISTRRLRIVKYRGSAHGTNEYPFVIDENGISVLPVTSTGLDSIASSDRVSTGIPDLDNMLGARGYYKGSTALISGTTGTGKTSVASSFAVASCRRGERVLYVSLEESASQIIRNMMSVGIDFRPFVKKDFLRIYASRPTTQGLEAHLIGLHNLCDQFKPQAVVIDPVTTLLSIGQTLDVKTMLVRTADFFKMNNITAVFTDLIRGIELEQTETVISSLVDTWIVLDAIEADGEINRTLRIIKSRGMEHSNKVKEFRIEDTGVRLLNAYLGPGGVLTGSARSLQEARDAAELARSKNEIERLRRSLAQLRRVKETQTKAIKTESENRAEDTEKLIEEEQKRIDMLMMTRKGLAKKRRETRQRSREGARRG